jgi:GT2 family glycosyltransferase
VVKLSIIIINYRSVDLIRDCLRSIYDSRPDTPFEIIIVNNEELFIGKNPFIQEFPEVSWTDMEYNAGFARGNNAGIRKASGEVILLLNPDTIMPPGALDSCFFQFINSHYVACGVQLLNEDGSPQISGNFFFRGGMNYLLPLPYTGKLIRALGKFFSAKVPHLADSNGLTEVDWINGAFLMVKKTTIVKAGLMDEDFFLYAEEAEWCARLKTVGRLCIFGNVKVYHLQGVSANETFLSTGKGYYNLFDKKGRQIILSNLLRIRKQYGIFWFIIILTAYTLTIPVFLAGMLFSLLLPASKRLYRFSDYFGFVDNVFFVWSLAPRIISRRPYFYKVL